MRGVGWKGGRWSGVRGLRMEEASMRFLLSIFCQSFTQAGFYYLMSAASLFLASFRLSPLLTVVS